MRFVNKVLRPDETILAVGRRHWISYWRAIGLLILALALFVGARFIDNHLVFDIPAGIAALAGLGFAAGAWFQQAITEIAVTDHRVIFKTGFIRRRTVEMNMHQVESVTIDQSLLGRILNYGTIHVLGAGKGIEHLHAIAAPVDLRLAINAHAGRAAGPARPPAP